MNVADSVMETGNGGALPTSQDSSPRSGSGGAGSLTEDQMSDEIASSRIKFMCSFGGKILPRPHDGHLRYVGGETRVIVVNRNITLFDLMSKLVKLVGRSIFLKYQLPNEDLDALISVVTEEDFDNMMDEYDRLETRDSSARLRLFLFIVKQQQNFDLSNVEQQFVDAVNGVTSPSASSKKQHPCEEGRSSSHYQNESAAAAVHHHFLQTQPVCCLSCTAQAEHRSPAPISVPSTSPVAALKSSEQDAAPLQNVAVLACPSPPSHHVTKVAQQQQQADTVPIKMQQRQYSTSDRNGSPRVSPKANYQDPYFISDAATSKQKPGNGTMSREIPAGKVLIDHDSSSMSEHLVEPRTVIHYHDAPMPFIQDLHSEHLKPIDTQTGDLEIRRASVESTNHLLDDSSAAQAAAAQRHHMQQPHYQLEWQCEEHVDVGLSKTVQRLSPAQVTWHGLAACQDVPTRHMYHIPGPPNVHRPAVAVGSSYCEQQQQQHSQQQQQQIAFYPRVACSCSRDQRSCSRAAVQSPSRFREFHDSPHQPHHNHIVLKQPHQQLGNEQTVENGQHVSGRHYAFSQQEAAEAMDVRRHLNPH